MPATVDSSTERELDTETAAEKSTVTLNYEAMLAAQDVLESTERELNGLVLLAELDGRGITIGSTLDDVDQVATILAEASWRAAGAQRRDT